MNVTPNFRTVQGRSGEPNALALPRSGSGQRGRLRLLGLNREVGPGESRGSIDPDGPGDWVRAAGTVVWGGGRGFPTARRIRRPARLRTQVGLRRPGISRMFERRRSGGTGLEAVTPAATYREIVERRQSGGERAPLNAGGGLALSVQRAESRFRTLQKHARDRPLRLTG